MSVQRITQVLLLLDPEADAEVGKALWAVFGEVAKLYNLDEERAVYETHLLAELEPRDLELPDRGTFLPLSADNRQAMLEEARGRYSDTLDQDTLTSLVRDLLDLPEREPHLLLIVTDQEITPPENWRYILWDAVDSGVVVSTAPMDPAYWGIEDPDRVRTIKHRARAGCMCVVGTALGLSRCDNEQCYLFKDVDSVARLDLMTSLGTEHEEIAREQAVGYMPHVLDPSAEQEISPASDLATDGWAPL